MIFEKNLYNCFVYFVILFSMSVFKEFKAFAMKGNVIDLAVGVIIGAAFGKIVTSIVEDLVMPTLGWLIGDIDFSNMYYVFPGSKAQYGLTLADAKTQGAVLAYGNFITITLNFLIVAVAIFIVVKAINKAKSQFEKEEAKVDEAPKGPTQEELLAEIRDLLKK